MTTRARAARASRCSSCSSRWASWPRCSSSCSGGLRVGLAAWQRGEERTADARPHAEPGGPARARPGWRLPVPGHHGDRAGAPHPLRRPARSPDLRHALGPAADGAADRVQRGQPQRRRRRARAAPAGPAQPRGAGPAGPRAGGRPHHRAPVPLPRPGAGGLAGARGTSTKEETLPRAVEITLVGGAGGTRRASRRSPSPSRPTSHEGRARRRPDRGAAGAGAARGRGDRVRRTPRASRPPWCARTGTASWASHLAEAGVQQAIREILSQAQVTALDGDGALVFYRALPGQTTAGAAARAAAHARPAGLRGVLLPDQRRGGAPRPQLERHLAASTGCCRRSTWTASSATSSPTRSRTGGTPTSCTALTAPRAKSTCGCRCPTARATPTSRTRRSCSRSAASRRELYFGGERPPGAGRSRHRGHRQHREPQHRLAARPQGLGLSDAEIADVVQTRVRAPYPTVPGRFAGRGFTVGSSTFRIEAEGLVGGVPRGRVVAVVRRGRPGRGAGSDDRLLAAGGRVMMPARIGLFLRQRPAHRGRHGRPGRGRALRRRGRGGPRGHPRRGAAGPRAHRTPRPRGPRSPGGGGQGDRAAPRGRRGRRRDDRLRSGAARAVPGRGGPVRLAGAADAAPTSRTTC